MTAKIFISHFSEDAAIAEAIERLVTALSREIDVRCSSSRTMGANVPPGTQWINWIVNEATSSDVSVVVLTPRSVASAWILWEAGLVMGASLREGSKKVLLWRVGLEPNRLPEPLSDWQSEDGTAKKGIDALLMEIAATLTNVRAREQMILAIGCGDARNEYLERIRPSATAPMDGLACGADELRQALAPALTQARQGPHRSATLELAFGHYLHRVAEKIGSWARNKPLVVPSAEYPHYLIKLQELGAQVRALALVDDVERFWARRLGQQILAGSERGRTRRIFAFRNAEDLREYATTVWEHSRKYEVRVASMQFLKPNFGDFARDFSIIQVPGDERPVLARYVTDRNEMGIEFTADTSQTAIHELKYATIWDKAIDPVDPDQERQFDMFVRTVFEARRPLEMSRYIKIEDYDRYEERHAHFVEMMERMVAEFLRSRDLDRFCKLLEMGAGTGHLTSRLIDRMDRKARLTALEYDFECYRYLLAKRNLRAAGGVCEILNEDSRTFDPHGKFDFIFSSFADHHIVRSEEQAGIYFENLKRNMHRHSFYIVGDEFLPPHDLNDRADRERALRHYHGYIIDVARKQQALAPEELKKEYDELIFLETRALESGLTNDGDFKVSLVQYLDRLERHGLAYDEPIPIGPLDSELRERVGGIYVIRVYLAPAQARSA